MPQHSDITKLLQAMRGDDEQDRQLDLVQVLVDSVQAASGTVPNSVTIDINGTLIPEIRYLSTYVPTAGDTAWAWTYGSDVVVIGILA